MHSFKNFLIDCLLVGIFSLNISFAFCATSWIELSLQTIDDPYQLYANGDIKTQNEALPITFLAQRDKETFEIGGIFFSINYQQIANEDALRVGIDWSIMWNTFSADFSPHLKTYAAKELIEFYYLVFPPSLQVELPFALARHLVDATVRPALIRPKSKGRVIGAKFSRTNESLKLEKNMGQPPRKIHRTEERS